MAQPPYRSQDRVRQVTVPGLLIPARRDWRRAVTASDRIAGARGPALQASARFLFCSCHRSAVRRRLRTIAKYHYTIGNKPDAGRAIAHGAMDVLTLGLWEVIGTPVEAIIVKHYDMTVTYDRDMRVIAVNAPVEMIKEEESQGVVTSD